MTIEPLLVILFFLTALIYATAGFAGGSTYLALFTLFALPFAELRQVALACNIIVAAGGTVLFWKAGYLSARTVLPFIVSSIPAAFLAARLPINKKTFTLLLGASLAIAALRVLLSREAFVKRRTPSVTTAWLVSIPIGILLGGLSGFVGIGGGIFLVPTLFALGWTTAKEAAAASSVFILVNSLAALIGQWTSMGSHLDMVLVLPVALAVLIGGQIGSRLGVYGLSPLVVQRMMAGVMAAVSGRLLWGVL